MAENEDLCVRYIGPGSEDFDLVAWLAAMPEVDLERLADAEEICEMILGPELGDSQFDLLPSNLKAIMWQRRLERSAPIRDLDS